MISDDYTSQLAHCLVDVANTPLPIEVNAKARLRLLDTLGVMVSSSRLTVDRTTIGFVQQQCGVAQASVPGTQVGKLCLLLHTKAYISHPKHEPFVQS